MIATRSRSPLAHLAATALLALPAAALPNQTPAPGLGAEVPRSQAAEAPAAAGQDTGQDAGPEGESNEPPLDAKTKAKYRTRFEQLNALVSTPGGMTSVFEDEAAVERGEAMLSKLIDNAGGWEAWSALPGLRLDQLETRYVLLNRDRDDWKVHHRVPRLLHFTPEGDGYALSEYTHANAKKPVFRREILRDKAAWSEQQNAFQRSPEVVEGARGLIRREFLLAAMPFSLRAMGVETAFVRETSRMDEGEDGALVEVPLEVYAVRLPESHFVRMDEFEWQEQLLLFVEPGTGSVAQIQYLVFDKDRDSYRTPFNRAYVNFYGTLDIGGVKVPRRRVAWHESPLIRVMAIAADLRAEAVPPAALRKPWLAGATWVPTEHADEWDPPGRNMLEESR